MLALSVPLGKSKSEAGVSEPRLACHSTLFIQEKQSCESQLAFSSGDARSGPGSSHAMGSSAASGCFCASKAFDMSYTINRENEQASSRQAREARSNPNKQ